MKLGRTSNLLLIIQFLVFAEDENPNKLSKSMRYLQNLLFLDSHNTRPRAFDLIRADYPFCPSSCSTSMKDDGWCNSECYNEECGFDGKDCEEWCAPDCKKEWIGDKVCDLDCFRAECDFDKNDCDNKYNRNLQLFPLPDAENFNFSKCKCQKYKLLNESCDWECNVPECNFDNGKCKHKCSEQCWTAWLGDGDCDTPCFNENCGFDKGDCKECSTGCRPDRIGNGICDNSCMTEDCFWDMGDCAGICKVFPIDYNHLPFEYEVCRKEWIGDGNCDCNCYVSECSWDGGDCKDKKEICEKTLKEHNKVIGDSFP